jgi:hypothetical protein
MNYQNLLQLTAPKIWQCVILNISCIYMLCWPDFCSSSGYDSLNSISVMFWIECFSGNGLKTVTWCPLRASSFISAECTVMWLLAGTGKIPRIFAPSVLQRHDIKIMRKCIFINNAEFCVTALQLLCPCGYGEGFHHKREIQEPLNYDVFVCPK